MDLELTFILITVSVWYWIVQKISVSISPLREEYRWRKRLAHLGYLILFSLQLTSHFIEATAIQWLVSIPAALCVLYILIISNFDREGFWSKQRNQVVGGISLLILGITLPVFVEKTTVIPVIFSIILTHGFYKNQIKQYAEVIRDLDSLRLKINRMEAKLHNSKLETIEGHRSSDVTFLYPESPEVTTYSSITS